MDEWLHGGHIVPVMMYSGSAGHQTALRGINVVRGTWLQSPVTLLLLRIVITVGVQMVRGIGGLLLMLFDEDVLILCLRQQQIRRLLPLQSVLQFQYSKVHRAQL